MNERLRRRGELAPEEAADAPVVARRPEAPHDIVRHLQQHAGNAAVARLLQRQPVDTPDTQPKMEADVAAQFTSEFSKWTGAYTALALRQSNAVDSIYTEAKKPKKPDLAEDLLIALATAAIGIPISIIGSQIGAAVERQLLKHVANPGMTENAALQAAYRNAQDGMKMLARSVNDGFKDGAKKLVGAKVQDAITKGKTPIDAFFESQKDGVVTAAEDARLKAEDMRVPILGLAKFHPHAPLWAARVLATAMHQEFTAAYEVQRVQTLEHWLSYQAQRIVNNKKVESVGEQPVTILHNVVERGHYQGGGSKRLGDAPGILFVDAYVSPGTGSEWTALAFRGHLAGLSPAMLGMLAGPIRTLNLPVVYRVSSLHSKDEDENGLGRSDLPQSMSPGAYAFCIGVNEGGQVWRSNRYPWQRKAVEKIGGEEKILNQLNLYSLAGLKVEPDHGD